MTDNYAEMIHMLESVAKVNQVVTLPYLEKKTGLQIIEKGQDHGMIVTEADRKVSQYLLEGGIENIPGIRTQYPGSFSEEDDTPERLQSTEIYQIDPLDGTGDMVDTYQGSRVVCPTTLVSKLERTSTDQNFTPVSGLIFEVLNQFALVSDGDRIGLYQFQDGKVKEIDYELTEHPFKIFSEPIKINRRPSYPQLTFDGPFIDYLKSQGLNIEQTNMGGAGTFALQFFRNYIQPKQEIKGFSELEPLTIGFNAQPDWKTWDTDATEVIANALNLPQRTDIYGNDLTANASRDTLQQMHHTRGYILSPNTTLANIFTKLTREFSIKNPNCPLTKKDYDYKNVILSLRE